MTTATTDGARRPPAPTLRLVLGAVLLVIVVAWGVQGPSGAMGLPSVDPAALSDALTLLDRAGVVVALRTAPGTPRDGVHPGDRPDQLVIGWTSGDCDPATTLETAGTPEALTITVTVAPCRGLGTGRSQAVTLRLNRPIPPSAVVVIQATGT